jgi:hypothetical protein
MVGTTIVPLVIQFTNKNSKSCRVFVLCHMSPPFFFAHPLNRLCGHQTSRSSSDFCPVMKKKICDLIQNSYGVHALFSFHKYRNFNGGIRPFFRTTHHLLLCNSDHSCSATLFYLGGLQAIAMHRTPDGRLSTPPFSHCHHPKFASND